MSFAESAKNLATILGAASIIGYISGYLIMRARASVLGTDSALSLIEEAYVFAGFRFLFVSLLFMLVAAPLAYGLRWLAVFIKQHAGGAASALDWVALAFLLLVLLYLLTRTLAVDAVLLTEAENWSVWDRAALGLSPGRSLVLTIATLTVFLLMAAWLQTRWPLQGTLLDGGVVLLVALLAFLLPMQHGTYFADRKVQVLERPPTTQTPLQAPIGVVDMTPDMASLFARNSRGKLSVVSVERKALHGIAISERTNVAAFTQLLAAAAPSAGTEDRSEETQNMSDNTSGQQTTLFARLLAEINATFTRIGSLGDSDVEQGQLWRATIAQDGTVQPPTRFGAADDLTWPVSSGDRVFALQGNAVVAVDEQGTIPYGEPGYDWFKLVGALPDGTILGITIDQEGSPQRAVLTPDGAIEVQPDTPDAATEIAFLMLETRSYTQDRSLGVDRPASGVGFDVVYRTPNRAQVVSDCQGDSCGQPSMSADASEILFVRQTRF